MRPRRDWMPWNDAERESLHNACSDPLLTWADIGQLIGRTGHACRVEATHHGWVPRVFTRSGRHRTPTMLNGKAWTLAEETMLANEWANASIDVFDIAAKHGRTAQAIYNRANKMRLGRKAIKVTPSAAQLSADHIAELLRRGISQETINMMGRR